MIPNLLLFSPFQKGYVRSHTRKGKQVGPYFTKRKPSQVQTKHTKERFIDHDKTSASKAHAELESLKAKHQELLDTAQKHHDELKSKGSSEGAVDHKTKLSHLKAEINNQKTHIENHTRKQNLIKDRYKISGKQIVRKKEKSDLDRKIAHHSDEQKKTIRAIHGAHKKGESKLEPGRILKGKDKDHIYLETKHKDTGETHHVAIHKDGSVKDPKILHGGKFDHKTLKEESAPKKIVVKSEPKKGVTVKKQEPFKKNEKTEGKKVVVKKKLKPLKQWETEKHPTIKNRTIFRKKANIDEIQSFFNTSGVKKGDTLQLGATQKQYLEVLKIENGDVFLEKRDAKGNPIKSFIAPLDDPNYKDKPGAKKIVVKKKEKPDPKTGKEEIRNESIQTKNHIAFLSGGPRLSRNRTDLKIGQKVYQYNDRGPIEYKIVGFKKPSKSQMVKTGSESHDVARHTTVLLERNYLGGKVKQSVKAYLLDKDKDAPDFFTKENATYGQLAKSFPTTSRQLENLLQEEKLTKSLKSPEEIKLLKEKRKRRKKRQKKR